MLKNRKLTELKNIGIRIARRLNQVGIFSEDELRSVGAVEAHNRIKQRYPSETLPVCYYLYSFEGAITDKHWNEIGNKKKQGAQGKNRLTSHFSGWLKPVHRMKFGELLDYETFKTSVADNRHH